MNNKAIRLAFVLLLGLMSLHAFAQQGKTVSGTVKDTDGFTVIGAAVIQDGNTSNGVVTDADGNFTIILSDTGKPSVTVSCMGYKEKRVAIGSSDNITVILELETLMMEEVQVVAYGVQKKETITGALSSVGTDQLLQSPNPNIANSLAGQMSGVSTVQTSGQPGEEAPQIYVRGAGSLTDEASSPLILVDGIEQSFFQMDPNEIENITVLKDASATAVFGVRGANGVILVTTRRGQEGKPKITVSSSVGISTPTGILETAGSYDYAMLYNERAMNDGTTKVSDLPFSPYAIEAFKTGSDPIIYPDTDWYDYVFKNSSVQTQHNINISGGTSKVKYFASIGYLYQDGLLKDFSETAGYNPNFTYSRYNFRTNLDIDVTRTTKLKLSLGGNVGDTKSPQTATDGMWKMLSQAQPFSSPGIVDGKLVKNDKIYTGITIYSGLDAFYGRGYTKSVKNNLNINLELTQKLDFITQGLSLSVKGAYNAYYTFTKSRTGSLETWTPFYASSINGSGLNPGDPGFDYTLKWRVSGTNSGLGYSESNAKDRDWYIEAALRYARKFGADKAHNVTALVLYNQSKNYYPAGDFIAQPMAYVGLVGRVTYDWKTRYLFEFNVGYNGSENFAPGKRFGLFPAVSAGWIISEEPFMKNQNVFNYLKVRATVGMVGNDNMSGYRYLYLNNSYTLKDGGYYFGTDVSQVQYAATEGRLPNLNVTWETALKQNYGIEATFLKSRLKLTADYFREYRKDILITRNTVPGIYAISGILPVVNMGEVRNAGFELELKWNHTVNGFNYWITGNTSFARNKILFMDEVEPNYPYMAETGHSTGLTFGYVADGFYGYDDFDTDGNLTEGLPDPGVTVHPGDVKYKNLNGDNVIDTDDQTWLGYSSRPEWTFGLNFGINWKGIEVTLNWVGATNRSVLLSDYYRIPFATTGNNALYSFMIDERWTPETAETAKAPRLSASSAAYNYRTSSLWVRDASYLRLKSAKIGYTFKKGKLMRLLGLNSAQIYMNGYNLLTLDGLKIIDPESLLDSSGYTYPITQTYNFGVILNF